MDWIFWLVLVIILAIIELATVRLLSIWFVLSGIVALILSLFIDNVAIVATIFAVLGIFLLFTTRPIFVKYLPTQKKRTKLARLITKEGIVTKKIIKDGIGEVKVSNRKYEATSNHNLEVGDKIIVTDLDGLKLVVKKQK